MRWVHPTSSLSLCVWGLVHKDFRCPVHKESAYVCAVHKDFQRPRFCPESSWRAVRKFCCHLCFVCAHPAVESLLECCPRVFCARSVKHGLCYCGVVVVILVIVVVFFLFFVVCVVNYCVSTVVVVEFMFVLLHVVQLCVCKFTEVQRILKETSSGGLCHEEFSVPLRNPTV